MRFVWELFLQPGHEQIQIRQDEIVSPYYEMKPFSKEENGELMMNVMYRYEDIFAPLLTEECVSLSLEKWMLNVLVHYLGSLDTKSGITVDEYLRRQCIYEMCQGNMGDQIRELTERVSQEVLYKIAVYYIRISKTEATITQFSNALIDIMGTGVLYRDKEENDRFYYYVGRKENYQDAAIIELVKRMLMPLGIRLRIFWEHHFGICGENMTMVENEIEIV